MSSFLYYKRYLLIWLITFYRRMADKDRVVYPDEVEDVKVKAKENEATISNVTQEPSQAHNSSENFFRNVIQVPDNCPAGQKMDIYGVCRDVF